MKVNAIVNNEIWLFAEKLPIEVIQNIQDALTIPNLEKANAEKQKLWGWEKLPDKELLYAWDGPWIRIPRGFFLRLSEGLKTLGYELDFEDRMTDINLGPQVRMLPNLRDYQKDAIESLKYFAQGIYQAPTGSGKTVTMIGLVGELQQPSLIIVNKKELLEQWSARFMEHAARSQIGMIGDNKWEEQDITIAMHQTLWARRDSLADTFWQKWGCVILDECHSVQADTYRKIISRFSAKYRFGVSATPRKTGEFKVAETILGPIVHKTPKQPLRDQGYLVTPKAFVVSTKFYYPFRENKVSGKGYVTKRNNYHEVLDRLVKNSERNRLIGSMAKQLTPGRCILILTKRLAHIELLKQELQSLERNVLVLTGQEKLEQRLEVYERAALGNCIILSTLADEAIDIPRIDTIFLAFPTKNTDLIRQQIGRGERPHPDKKQFHIYDFVDYSIPPIKQQYRDRKIEVYRREDIEVTKLSASET